MAATLAYNLHLVDRYSIQQPAIYGLILLILNINLVTNCTTAYKIIWLAATLAYNLQLVDHYSNLQPAIYGFILLIYNLHLVTNCTLPKPTPRWPLRGPKPS